METILEASGLVKQYKGVRAVDGLDLTVRRGDVFGFLGPNGAGKSTTIRMAVGLIHPTSGSVRILGRDVMRERHRALKKVGALVESPSFFKYLTGRENLSIVGRMNGGITRKEIQSVLEDVGLAEKADAKVRTYSHGMQQRLGIASAILGRPELVILDEPTNGLDPQGMKDVRLLIRELAEKHGMTVFLSSHLLHEVEQVCSRVAIVNRGRLVAAGDVKDLLSGSNSIQVSTDDPEKAAQVLEGLDWAVVTNLQPEGLTVAVSDGRSAELNRLLVTSGVNVSVLAPKKHSLEEIYMKVTGSVDSDQA